MSRLKILFLIMIWAWHNDAQAQSMQGLLLKGHIANFTTKFLLLNSGKELTRYANERIVVDNAGNFEAWFPKRSVSGYLHLNNRNGFDLNLYAEDADSITLNWSDRNPPASLKIHEQLLVSSYERLKKENRESSKVTAFNK